MTDTSDTAVNQLPHLRTGVRVQLSSPDGKLQLFTPFVGIEGDKAVILHLPSRSEVEKNNNNERAAVIWYENLLQNKPGVVVRFIEGGVVYAFKCSVLDVVTGKVQLLVLEYPKDICTRCVRKEPRYDCTLRVKLLSDVQQEGIVKRSELQRLSGSSAEPGALGDAQRAQVTGRENRPGDVAPLPATTSKK